MAEPTKDAATNQLLLSMQPKPTNSIPNLPSQTPEFPDSDPVDLSLGLSLGGHYGQIPHEKPLLWASFLNRDLIPNDTDAGEFLSLARSVSEPTEAEKVVMRVKEVQAKKRMEAKRRLLEKQRMQQGRGGGGGGGAEEEKEKTTHKPLADPEFTSWAIESATRNSAFRRAMDKVKSVGANSSTNPTIRGPESSIPPKAPTFSQPTVTPKPKDNGKSVVPSYRSEPVVKIGNMADGRSPNPRTYLSAPPVVTVGTVANGNHVGPSSSRSDSRVSLLARIDQERRAKRVRDSSNRIEDVQTVDLLKRMPSVTTTGNGPNGRRVEGFLLRYSVKGKVTIVCICHGNFLTPAEFVRHAGGTDVENPMKYITVLPGTL